MLRVSSRHPGAVQAESEPEDMAAVMPAPLGISIIREEEESGLPGMVEEDPPSVCEDLTADPESWKHPVRTLHAWALPTTRNA